MVEGSELPSGVVTFLFTDIEGSTRLIRVLGADGYQDMLDRHQDILRLAWSRHRGFEVHTEGDAFLVAFERAEDAIAAAVTAQQLLERSSWDDVVQPAVRMGIHTGFARPHRDNYAALSVNQAARVVDAAHGGQVLVSQDAVDQAREHLDAELSSMEPLGRFAIRDFVDPMPLHRVVVDGWSASTRPPRLVPAEGHNIVPPLTRMVDREVDSAQVEAGLAAGRVVTVVGPGGVGKTRLATHVALTVADRWRDGVWMVDLEPAATFDRVAGAIADAIGAPPQPGRPAIDDLVAHLAESEALLVLDNCEQALQAVGAVVGEVLEACRGVGILATSRAPIGMRCELVHRLQPLPSDDVVSPAVELFLERTAADHDREVVVELCQLVEGLPLAIELVAARTSSIGAATALDWLREHPLALQGRDPTLPERHRSLQRVLDWSHELLGPGEQALLRRLGVFAGSFDLAAATAAAAAASSPALAPVDVPELLFALLDHSLVLEEPGGRGRLRLFGSVRVYASAITEADERQRTVRAVAAHLLDRLGPDRVTARDWPGEMTAWLPNVQAVIDELVRLDEETAHTLAWAVAHHCRVTGAHATGIEEARRHLDLLAAEGPARVALLTELAAIQLRVGDLARARGVLDRASELASRVGMPAWDEQALQRVRGEVALREGDLARAESLGREALGQADTPTSRARAWNLIGIALGSGPRVRDAAAAFREELAAAEAADADFLRSKAHANLAEMHQRLGEPAAAAHHQLACLEIGRANGERVMVGYSVMLAARLLPPERAAEAAELNGAAQEILRSAGVELYESDADVDLAFEERLASALGASALEQATARGGALGLQEAADRAAAVLEDVARTEGAHDERRTQGAAGRA